MTGMGKKLFAVGLAALLVTAVALAAAPVKNGLYIGKLTGRGLEKRVELHVAKSGKTATAGLYCANTLAGKLKPFPITKGRFNATKRVGSVLVFRLKGHFVTKATVAVGLLPRAVCDGVGGSFTLKLSSSG
jgi:hypothetical protein